MEIRSLAYRTDLIFPKFDGIILDRESYLVILSPSNPTFYWGNFLLFQNPPGKDDLGNWKAIFAREIGSRINPEHFAFGWDSPEGYIGQVQPFLEDGFNLNRSVVLTTRQVVQPPNFNRDVIIRPITADWEWEQALQNQIECRPSGFSSQGYQVFKQNQMIRYRRMTGLGLGFWFGAFLHEHLVADLGLFVSGKIARFQQVETHPEFRRRGICGALVYQASCYAFDRMNVDTLVMVADEEYHAARIYESIGFIPGEHQVGLDWWGKSQP